MWVNGDHERGTTPPSLMPVPPHVRSSAFNHRISSPDDGAVAVQDGRVVGHIKGGQQPRKSASIAFAMACSVNSGISSRMCWACPLRMCHHPHVPQMHGVARDVLFTCLGILIGRSVGESELLAKTTTFLPEASMARRVTFPSSIMISCMTSTE